ncbi:MAG: sigma-70 family RNA polymerase sigma factor [Chthonomonas sp.]|nr:sigma-70 family RNA polymerase sigma factor [Chthonomonas sp.]
MSAIFGVKRLANQERLDASAEQALVEQCRRQNFEAFGKIVDAYQSRVTGFVRRMVASGEEAEDIAQEVFIRAYQNMSRFDGRSSLRTWLFRIAYNLCVDHARKKQRIAPEFSMTENEDSIDVSDVRWDPEAIVLGDELRDVIENAILTMSEKLRTVLLLHDREELGYEELAGMLNVPVGTIKSRLFLARSHVQKAVESYRR